MIHYSRVLLFDELLILHPIYDSQPNNHVKLLVDLSPLSLLHGSLLFDQIWLIFEEVTAWVEQRVESWVFAYKAFID